MGLDTIPARSDNTTIYAEHVNVFRRVLAEDLVPRNTSGVITDEGGSLGTSTYRWLNGYIRNLYIGTAATPHSLIENGATLEMNINGTLAATLSANGFNTASFEDDSVTADKLAHTAVTPGTYGASSSVSTFTVDQQGRITAASNTAIASLNASVLTAGTINIARSWALSGDITKSAGSATTAIAAGVIVNADISTSAEIDRDKLGDPSVTADTSVGGVTGTTTETTIASLTIPASGGTGDRVALVILQPDNDNASSYFATTCAAGTELIFNVGSNSYRATMMIGGVADTCYNYMVFVQIGAAATTVSLEAKNGSTTGGVTTSNYELIAMVF